MTDKRPEKERKNPIMKGNVYVPKETKVHKLYSLFFSASPSEVLKNVIKYVLLPDAKYTMNNMGRKAVDMMTYGVEEGRGRPSSGSRRNTREPHDYRQHSRKNDRVAFQNESQIRTSARADSWKDLEFEYKSDCEKIICELQEDIIDYEEASVARIYDILGFTPDPIHFEWGWENLDDADCEIGRSGKWRLIMPKMVRLGK